MMNYIYSDPITGELVGDTSCRCPHLNDDAYEYAYQRAREEGDVDIDVDYVEETVVFGRYPQGANGEVAPIEWLKLAIKDGKILLISRYGLEALPYSVGKYDYAEWSQAILNDYLNEFFVEQAFYTEEQEAILTTQVDNSQRQGNPKWNTSGGKDTKDKVFLLSYAEAEMYFENGNDRKCAPTEYAVKHGAYTSSSNKVDGKAACVWWLRSPGDYESEAAAVCSDGSLCCKYYVGTDGIVVRPAMWVDLKCLRKHQPVNEILPF